MIDDLNRLVCIFYSVPYHLDYPIIILEFLVAGNIVKSPNIGSILISSVEDVYELSVIHYLLAPKYILHHGIYFLL